jgi:DNA mismatch endonuclease (patch repair protein)
MLLRRGLHARGIRYRLHARELPGKPDMVFPARKAVLFAHGCFWHGHDCHLFRLPSTRPEFWSAKIERNRAVDERSTAALRAAGWRVGVVWECALKGRTRLPFEEVLDRCEAWIRGTGESLEIHGAGP